MIAESVAFLVGAGKRVDLRRRALLRRLPRRPRLRAASACARPPARAPSASCLCDTNGSSLPPPVAEATRRGRGRRWAPASRVGIHCHNDAECGVANTLAAVEAGATPGPGHDERRRRAHRQRQPRLDHRQPAAEAGPRRRLAASSWRKLTETAHFVDELLNRHARPRPGLRRARTPSRTRAACTSPASAPTRRPSSTSTRRWSATRASCSSPSCRARTRWPRRPRAAGLDARRRGRRAGHRARQGARARRLPVRGRRRLVRAAPAPARPASTSRSSAWSPGA